MPVFEKGFAAGESEFLLRIGTGRDASDVAFATIFGTVQWTMPKIAMTTDRPRVCACWPHSIISVGIRWAETTSASKGMLACVHASISAKTIGATIGGSAVTSALPTVTVNPGAISVAQSLVSVSSATVLACRRERPTSTYGLTSGRPGRRAQVSGRRSAGAP